mmetsp:Transcript_26113/g.56565  ORF Transcript_26113/g.56565 Transcript_26113/m.56565 type:complete len:232 (+) Transcript_26113:684-1379(+)
MPEQRRHAVSEYCLLCSGCSVRLPAFSVHRQHQQQKLTPPSQVVPISANYPSPRLRSRAKQCYHPWAFVDIQMIVATHPHVQLPIVNPHQHVHSWQRLAHTLYPVAFCHVHHKPGRHLHLNVHRRSIVALHPAALALNQHHPKTQHHAVVFHHHYPSFLQHQYMPLISIAPSVVYMQRVGAWYQLLSPCLPFLAMHPVYFSQSFRRACNTRHNTVPIVLRYPRQKSMQDAP